MRTIGVIPARFASTRFPAKVLASICGKPMIEHVYNKAKACTQLDDLIIACDHADVLKTAQGFGAKVVMTDPNHPSGSDRIAEAIMNLDVDIVVNIQGDEPFIDPKTVDSLAVLLKNDAECQMGTVIKEILIDDDFQNPNVVKCVIDAQGYALYFSRSPIPYNRNTQKPAGLKQYKHLGLYAYRKDFLLQYKDWSKSILETTEQLEQLRVLEKGYRIKTVVTTAESIAVDTPEDLKKGGRMVRTIKVNNISFGGKNPFVLIAGPCVIESKQSALKIAADIQKITKKLKVPFIFKASYDKANRTSINSFRGPGIMDGLKILADIKRELNVPILSDIHCRHEIELAAEVLDIIQIPAFLCRQTDLIVAAAKTGKVVNVKKGQFLAPWDMKGVIKKMEEAGSQRLLLTERGVSFGYNNLVSDFRSLDVMRKTGYPVIFDATHSVQQPGGLGHASGGDSQYVPLLARCAVAAGVDGIFLETHPNPAKALSDGPNMIPLKDLEKLLKDLVAIDRIIKK